MRKLLPLTLLFLFLAAHVVEAQILRRPAAQQQQQQGTARSANLADPRLSAIPSSHPSQPPSAQRASMPGTSGVLKSLDGPLPTEGLTHPRNHVLLIGVNQYAHADFRNLRFCVRDMEGLKSALIQARFCNAEDVQLLVSGAGGNREPTRENVESAFQTLLNKIEPGDRVLVAFSGHGIALPLEGDPKVTEDFLACADARVVFDEGPLGQRFVAREGIISRPRLEEALDASAASVKLVFIDACRNVAMPGITSNAPGSRGIGGLAKFGEVSGMYSNIRNGLFRLSSASPGEISWEHPSLEHGLFTHFLIQGLQGAAPQRRPGRITLQDLHSYVRRATREYIESNPASFPGTNTRQSPTMVILPIEGSLDPDEILIAYHLGGQTLDVDSRINLEEQRAREAQRERDDYQRLLAEYQRLLAQEQQRNQVQVNPALNRPTPTNTPQTALLQQQISSLQQQERVASTNAQQLRGYSNPNRRAVNPSPR